MERETKILLKRRLIIAAVIVICALLQTTIGYFPSIFGIHFFLLVPLCVCIAVFEGERWGAAFGIFAGALWDLSHGGGDGYVQRVQFSQHRNADMGVCGLAPTIGQACGLRPHHDSHRALHVRIIIKI